MSLQTLRKVSLKSSKNFRVTGSLSKALAQVGLPGAGVGAVIFGPGQVRQVVFQERAHVSAALAPAEGGEFGALDLVAFEVGEGEALVIGGGADEEEVFVLPGLEAGVAPPAGDEAAQNLAQGSAVHLRIGELNEEDAPRLAGDKGAELAHRAALKAGRVAVGQTKLIRRPVKSEVIGDGVRGDGPAEFIAKVGDEVGQRLDPLDRFGIGGVLGHLRERGMRSADCGMMMRDAS